MAKDKRLDLIVECLQNSFNGIIGEISHKNRYNEIYD